MRNFLLGLVCCAAVALPAAAQQKITLSIATGPTGGVYYPMGGGMANILSKSVPGLSATAEATAAVAAVVQRNSRRDNAGEGLQLLQKQDWCIMSLSSREPCCCGRRCYSGRGLAASGAMQRCRPDVGYRPPGRARHRDEDGVTAA